jgi:thiol:disulfide interchange protein DsbD
VAVSLGYDNVYRYPTGFPEWQEKGLPSTKIDNFIETARQVESSIAAQPPSGLTLLWTLLGVFVGGMALNLTPCVYPLIPITVSYFGGRSGKSQGAITAHAFCYLGGLAVTNSTLGVIAALTGGLMGALLQSSWVLAGIAAVLLIFALSLFGLWELRLPSALTSAASKSYSGYLGSVFMGLTLGIIAAPCIGPFVLGLLTWVASIGLAWFGFIIFFTLSLGLGLPLFILALFSGKLDKLPRSGEWMIWVRKLMGWVLVGMAAYFLRPLFSQSVSVILYCIIALSAGIHLALVDKSQATFGAFGWIKNGIGLLCVASVIFLGGNLLLKGPGVVWQPYTADRLEQARLEQRPVIIDFYATWCAPCRELDEITFHDQEVVKETKQFEMVKIDLTKGDNPVYQNLLESYSVKGVPTLVFLDKNGQERSDLRLVDFMKPKDFIIHMKKVMQ